MELNLQYFDSTYTVTCLNGGNFSAFSASPNSSVAKGATVTLTVTPASGYELDEIEVCAGGVTITETSGTYTFTMGEANVTLFAKAKANNKYIVVEDIDVTINGTKTHLGKNVKLQQTANGGVYGATVSGTAITFDAAVVKQLVADGVIVKI